MVHGWETIDSTRLWVVYRDPKSRRIARQFKRVGRDCPIPPKLRRETSFIVMAKKHLPDGTLPEIVALARAWRCWAENIPATP